MGISGDLQKIINDSSRILSAGEIGEKQLSDALGHHIGKADALVQPLTTEEVSAVMAYAFDKRIPVTVRGAGKNLTGATVPLSGGIIIDLTKMNHLIEIDKETFTATVEAGIVLDDFQHAVEAEGLFYPPDPGEKLATVGGNISTNAGGMRAVKYGVTRDYVRSLEFVMSDGTVLTLGSKNVKDASGLSLKNLIIGSEGTLGIITKCILRLVPLPKVTIGVVIAFASLSDGIRAVHRILMAGTDPVAVEFLERNVVTLGEKYTGETFPFSTGEAYIILSYDGESREGIERRITLAKAAALGNTDADGDAVGGDSAERGTGDAIGDAASGGAIDFLILDDKAKLASVWMIRGCLVNAVEAVSEQEPVDIVVPINRISDFIDTAHKLEEQTGIHMVAFGHAGDGNVHLCILREKRSKQQWKSELEALMDDMYSSISEMGGLTSGEHGIGIAKQRYFLANTAKENLALMNGIKALFDPRNILNPGKAYQKG
jgi:glycolate oxidase